MAGIYHEQPGRFRSQNFEAYESTASADIANYEFFSDDTHGRAKIEFTLRNAENELVVSTSVKYAIFDYKQGSPYINEWMKPVYRGVTTTDGSGLFTINYPGVSPVGSLAYVAILTASESFIHPISITYG